LDSNKQPISVTSTTIDLLNRNKQRLLDIEQGLIHDNIHYSPFTEALSESFKILNTEPNIFLAHTSIRNILWREIQCSPLYNRSLAFTFIEHQEPIIITTKYQTYKDKFISLLGEKKYDPNRISDRQQIFRAMLKSYKEIDKDLSKKIKHMVNEGGIIIDTDFMQSF
jgi:hypothetical protein